MNLSAWEQDMTNVHYIDGTDSRKTYAIIGSRDEDLNVVLAVKLECYMNPKVNGKVLFLFRVRVCGRIAKVTGQDLLSVVNADQFTGTQAKVGDYHVSRPLTVEVKDTFFDSDVTNVLADGLFDDILNQLQSMAPGFTFRRDAAGIVNDCASGAFKQAVYDSIQADGVMIS